MFTGFTWNVPNALTLFRLFCVAVSVVPLVPIGNLSSDRMALSLWFFVLGAISDYFDGYFARKLNQTTPWGAYMDPLIDKIFIWCIFLAFIFIPFIRIPWWLVAPVILRDVAVTHMRNTAIRHSIPFKTSFLAKSKTAVQMVVGVFILCYLWLTLLVVEGYNLGEPERMWSAIPWVKSLPFILTALMTAFTLLSLADYVFAFLRNKKASQ